MATTFRRISLAAIFVAVMLVPAFAQADDAGRGIWLAMTNGAAQIGTLSLRDGKLLFRASTAADSWDVDLADAKRVELSRAASNAIEIESGWGQTYVVRILNSRLTPESPSKALKTIGLALRSSADAGRSRAADAAAGGQAADSVKVVRVNGGQIR